MSTSTTYELVRNRAALFDASDEGRFFVSGADAEQAVNSIIAADLEAIPELKALNTVTLSDEGAITAILWVLKDEEGIWIMCDADRRDQVRRVLQRASDARRAKLEDRSDSTFCLALIGPLGQAIAMEVGGEDVVGIPYLGFEPNAETDTLLCRLGYTGEFDYRFIADVARRDEMRQRLLDAGAGYGLADGDNKELPRLMLEMRSLHQASHIPDGTGPIQAGLHWMVDFRKEGYPGCDAIHQAKGDPSVKALMLIIDGDVPSSAPAPVRLEGQEVGRCVCLARSPTLGKTMGLAYVQADLAWVGIVFDVDGRDATAVSSPLFITKTVSTND